MGAPDRSDLASDPWVTLSVCPRRTSDHDIYPPFEVSVERYQRRAQPQLRFPESELTSYLALLAPKAHLGHERLAPSPSHLGSKTDSAITAEVGYTAMAGADRSGRLRFRDC
jgi:hypothetical protein